MKRPQHPRLAAMMVATGLALTLMAGCSGEEESPASPPPPPVTLADMPDEAALKVQLAEATKAERPSQTAQNLAPAIGTIGMLNAEMQRCLGDVALTGPLDQCLFGTPEADAKKVIFLWGDARAAQWLPGLAFAGKERGVLVVAITKLMCPPVLNTTAWLSTEWRSYTECTEFNQAALDYITTYKPDQVIMSGASRGFILPTAPRGPAPKAYLEGLGQAIKAVTDEGIKVTLLGESPYVRKDPSTCALAHLDDIGECGVPRPDALFVDPADERRAAEDNGATYVATMPWMCSGMICPPVVRDVWLYRDGWHVNSQWAFYLSRVLGDAVGMKAADPSPSPESDKSGKSGGTEKTESAAMTEGKSSRPGKPAHRAVGTPKAH